AGLDLPAIEGDGEVGDGGILGLAAAVRHHRGVGGTVGGVDGVEGLGERADLVDLHQDGAGDAHLDAGAEALGVGDEEVVAGQLHAVAEAFRQRLPAVPVVLPHAVLDAYDREAGHQVLEELRIVLRQEAATPHFHTVLPYLEDLHSSAGTATSVYDERGVA